MKTQKFEELCCSFCGKHARTVKKLITGPSVCICDECIGRCNRIISEEREKQWGKPVKPRDIPLPKRLRVLVSLESRFVEHLIAWREQTSAVLPGALQQAIKSLGESARGIRAESERWISEQAVPVTKEETVALCCSFCGLPRREVRELIAGPNTYICDECIGLCNDIIAEDSEQHVAKETPPEDVPVPKVLGRMVHAESHWAGELVTCRERNSGVLSESLQQAIQHLGESSGALRIESERWIAEQMDPSLH
jgi:ATP-dependent protease Clp ATPase subunit